MSELVKEHSKGTDRQESVGFRIGVLLYFGNEDGRLLLMQRQRQPNRGLWCAVGGKLEMPSGESPYECAIREAKEEVGVELSTADLALRCMLSERSYENSGHWLMFVFEVLTPLNHLPDCIEEGCFEFFDLEMLDEIEMPVLDRSILFDRILGDERSSLHVLKAPVGADRNPELLVEEDRIGLERDE